MFAWVEHVEKETKKKLGGGSDTITTYKYTQEWTDHPRESSGFEHPDGHDNPRPHVEAKTFTAKAAAIGAYAFDPDGAELPAAQRIALEADLLTVPTGDAPAEPAPEERPAEPKHGKHHHRSHAAAPAPTAKAAPEWRLAGAWLFHGPGTPDEPRVGATRVSFAALDPGQLATLFGEQRGANVRPFVDAGNNRLYRVVLGTRQQAIQRMHAEHQTITWLLRGLGFFLMWIGLGMFFAPINAVLDVVPFLGSMGRFVTGLLVFPVALALSGLTILLSIIAHSTILLVVTLVVIVGGVGALIFVRGRKRGAAAGGG
jgi:Transmembrane protein 43